MEGGPLWDLWEGSLSNLPAKEWLCEVKCYDGPTTGVSIHSQPVRRAGGGGGERPSLVAGRSDVFGVHCTET